MISPTPPIQQLPNTKANYQLTNFTSYLGVILCHPWTPTNSFLHAFIIQPILEFFIHHHVTILELSFIGSQINWGNYQLQQLQEASDFLLSGRCDSNINNNNDSIILNRNNKVKVSPPTHVLFIGYSYGCLITTSASQQLNQCIGNICISPPMGVLHMLSMMESQYNMQSARENIDIPRLVIMGKYTNMTKSDKQELNGSYKEGNTFVEMIESKETFFQDMPTELVNVIEDWLIKNYIPSNHSLWDIGKLTRDELTLKRADYNPWNEYSLGEIHKNKKLRCTQSDTDNERNILLRKNTFRRESSILSSRNSEGTKLWEDCLLICTHLIGNLLICVTCDGYELYLP